MYNIASRAYPQILFARAALAAAADPPDLAFRSAARRPPPPTSRLPLSECAMDFDTRPMMCVCWSNMKWSNMGP